MANQAPHQHTYAGSLFIISAPSGAGKSSLVNALLAKDAGLSLSISHTTRAPRSGEQEGKNYHFVSETEFQMMRARNEFIEHAHVHGNWYGTSRTWIESRMQNDADVILEIDWQGANQVKSLQAQAVSIFILPPSMVELERRLRGRGTDSDTVIAGRLAAAVDELAQAKYYDYAILNDHFETALAELAAIVSASRCRIGQQLARRRDQLQAGGLNVVLPE